MKSFSNRLVRFGTAVVTVWMTASALGAAALQQDGASKAMEYDPVMAKRTDLRSQYDASSHKCVSTGTLKIDHSKLVDFMNVLPKRADLRMRVAKVGLEQAYAEWSHQAGSK